MPPQQPLVIGLDYGSDSVRALLISVTDGAELACGVCEYPRWAKGLYCVPEHDQYRQHPLDYLEAAESAVRQLFPSGEAGAALRQRVVGLGVDTTGSTPCLVDAGCNPLALQPAFSENPNAMFILWKDHTAVDDAAAINKHARSQRPDYTSFSGGTYSSEWFWAKALHVINADKAVAEAAHSIVECSEWLPAHFTGVSSYDALVRSRCACGHKAMWHESWGGFPPAEFFAALHPLLGAYRARMSDTTTTADVPVGRLSPAWAERFGLSTSVVVGGGVIDAHAGAIGAGITPHTFLRVMGTSTCDMMVLEPSETAARTCIPGICGQVDGSIIPGEVGLEAGQSAYGDVFAWFGRLLSQSAVAVLRQHGGLSAAKVDEVARVLHGKMLSHLGEEAARSVGVDSARAVDWFNGRRTPHANQRLRGAISGLSIGTTGPGVFAALLEATAFGSRAIVDHLREQGIRIDNVVAVGGITKKSPLAMQVLADALDMPVQVCASAQTCALGAAVIAATAAGCYPTMADAQKTIASRISATFHPKPDQVRRLAGRYADYRALAGATEPLYSHM